MKKYLTLVVLVFTLLVLLIQSSLASFKDVNDPHRQKAINWLQDNGIVQGYSDETFKPNNNINRAEFLKMIYSTIGMKDSEINLPFSDVPGDAWYTKYVKEAYANKVINGYNDGTFKPEQNISFAEAIKIIANSFFNVEDLYGDGSNTTYSCPGNFFTSSPLEGSEKEWYWKYANVTGELCVFDFGLSVWGIGGVFPNNPISRSDMAEMLYRAKAVHDNDNKKYDEVIEPQTSNKSKKNENDLLSLYKKAPSQADIDQIMSDFNIVWAPDEKTGEVWQDNFNFDQKSTDPGKIVAIAKLNVLKHQTFAEPLPFTNKKNIYDYVKANAKNIQLDLDCHFDFAGADGALHLDRAFSVWDGRSADDCKKSYENTLFNYVSPLYLLIHEARHFEIGDPGHVTCSDNTPGDEYLENGSGYATAALYSMWVYKYGINDPTEIKQQAKDISISLLGRICSKPTHSNPKVQAIIDELMK